MAKPMGKRRRRTKQTYLGSGAGSLRSGTGTTAKKPKKPKRNLELLDDIRKEIFREYRSIPKPKGRELRPLRPKSPATGFNSVFEKQKTRKKRTATTLRRRAKR